MNEATFQFIVARVVDNAMDAMNQLRENPHDEFYKGKRLAYYEVLDTIKNELCVRGAELEAYKLDVNLERAFLKQA